MCPATTNSATGFPLVGAFDTGYGGGAEAFVTKFSPTGSTLVYSTFLGGSGFDAVYNIKVTAAGNAVVVGESDSSTFTTALPGAYQAANTNGQSDAFVAMLNAAGTGLVYGTFLGGNQDDFGYGVALDAAGRIYITGDTSSNNFDVTAGAMQTVRAGNSDGFIAVINPAASGAASLALLDLRGRIGRRSLLGDRRGPGGPRVRRGLHEVRQCHCHGQCAPVGQRGRRGHLRLSARSRSQRCCRPRLCELPRRSPTTRTPGPPATPTASSTSPGTRHRPPASPRAGTTPSSTAASTATWRRSASRRRR